MHHYDLIVLRTGNAGLCAALSLASKGLEVRDEHKKNNSDVTCVGIVGVAILAGKSRT